MSSLLVILNSLLVTLGFAVALALVTIFSWLSFWKENSPLFMATAGVALMAGLYAPDGLSVGGATTSLGITAGLGLILYSILCCGFAIRLMFWSSE